MNKIKVNQIIDVLRLISSVSLTLVAFFNAPGTIILMMLVFFLLGIDIRVDKGIKMKIGTMFKFKKD